MRKLSDRQQRILDFLAEYTSDHGYPPSIREIGQAVGISSTSVVDYNLRALERSGMIRRDREVSRGLGLVGQPGQTATLARPSLVRVPIVGRIAAGEPIEALEQHDDYLELGAGTVPDGCYALQVKGKSMIEDLIDDGDLVVIRPQETAENGDIVVALLMSQGPSTEGVATLKRLYRERGQVRLQPANAAMQPIYVDPSQLRVQGKVVQVVRYL
ncbi:MAG: transcriptional repressor LexA [Chloroflexi bacterium]|nr:transcriptional repressor LexA [Chloroflexota bacterium]